MDHDTATLTGLLHSLDSDREGQQLTLGEVVQVIGKRGFGPLMLVLALIAILPTGAVPGVPTICGLSIALIAVQLALGKRAPWLPRRLRRLSIKRETFGRVAQRVTPWTRRVDQLVRPRLVWLTEGVAVRVVGLICVGLALCMPPLELLPFAAALPAGGIVLLGLGLTGKDGLWVLLGLIPAVIAVGMAVKAGFMLL